jgi:hypothetical protein
MRKNIGNVIESWKRGEARAGRTFLLPETKAPSRTTKMQVRAISLAVPYAAALEDS